MKIYNVLAAYYDALVKDEAATNQYVAFVMQHSKHKQILELACGSGEISLALANAGYNVTATDLSIDMLEIAKAKDKKNLIHFDQMDMRNVKSEHKFDTVLCFCDSMNYLALQDLPKMFSSIYDILCDEGIFIFDMHSEDRLIEFQEEFYEAGVVEGCEYTWSIVSEQDKLYHTFVFYDEQARPKYEYHIQTVFPLNEVLTQLQKTGFKSEVYTDFDHEGKQYGEKYFLVCRKETR